MLEANFKDGVLDGVRRIWSDPDAFEPFVLEEWNYKNGKLDGTYKRRHHPDGVLDVELNFKDGKNGEICIQFVNNNKFFLTVFLPLDSVNQFQKGILVLIYISVYNLKKKIEKKLIFGIISEIDHYCHILKIEIGLKNRHIFLNPRSRKSK